MSNLEEELRRVREVLQGNGGEKELVQ